MVLVYLKTGECIEVQDASSAVRRAGSLACLNQEGEVTATFAATEIESFTANEVLAEALKEELCEDLTVMNRGEVVEAESEPA